MDFVTTAPKVRGAWLQLRNPYPCGVVWWRADVRSWLLSGLLRVERSVSAHDQIPDIFGLNWIVVPYFRIGLRMSTVARLPQPILI